MILFLTEGTDNWFYRCLESGLTGSLVFWSAVIFWLGCCIGSFLNVCIWRIPRGESIVFGASRCPHCRTVLKWYDNVPIWGFLHLKGKCRFCRGRISPRYLGMELLTGGLFLLVFLKTGLTGEPPDVLWRYCPMLMLAITTFFIDRKHFIIPDVTTYPAMIYALILSAAMPEVWGTDNVLQSMIFSVSGLGVFGIFTALFAMLGRRIYGTDVLGWGDVKYLMAAGALTGTAGAFVSLLSGSFTGMLYGIMRAAGHRRSLRRTAIPLGPFLAAGSLLWILAGEKLLRLYLGI